MWPDNRIARDAHYLYRYDRHGRLTGNRPHPEGLSARMMSGLTGIITTAGTGWCTTRTQYAEPLVESRYLYDPLGAGWQNGYGGVNGT
ncbi:hypothetical protein ECZU03_39140 [Escherichia coli]|nr:hypothetical protein ECZU03_39140 [Escherichia coli]